MTKNILLLLLIICIISCNGEIKTVKESKQSEELNSVENPNLFVGKHKAKAMVLGVFHFDYPELDTHISEYQVNVLEAKRQGEIENLLEKIAKYKPTKILLEFPRINGDSIMNERYKRFLTGKFDIKNEKSEWYQIGFRLAKKLNHSRIYSVDANAKWCGPDLDWDNYSVDKYLKEHNQFDKSTRYDYEMFYKNGDSLTKVLTLTEYFIYDNNPKIRLKDHQAYLTETVLEGAGDNYVGAASVSRWYQRNIKIFSNAYDITDFNNPERLLLIFGSGHVWQLRQFFSDSPDFEYVEPNEYLTK